jgi:hypothetical protein
MQDVEIDSIDEGLSDLSDMRERDRLALAQDLRATVRAWTGIPTCVGLRPMKTLAKRADHIARTALTLNGACDPTDPVQYDHRLCRIHVGELWGIGRAALAKLRDGTDRFRGAGFLLREPLTRGPIATQAVPRSARQGSEAAAMVPRPGRFIRCGARSCFSRPV